MCFQQILDECWDWNIYFLIKRAADDTHTVLLYDDKYLYNEQNGTWSKFDYSLKSLEF